METRQELPRPLPVCALCQQRKVRCDRKYPCSNCVKADESCIPCPPPQPPRARRNPKLVLQARLERCELLLRECQSKKAHPSPTGSENNHPTGQIVVEDGSISFTDSSVHGLLQTELQSMRVALDMDDSNAPFFNLDHDGVPDPPDFCSLQPSPMQGLYLWQVFVDRVHPLTKILHPPSLQPRWVEAANGINEECVKTLGVSCRTASRNFVMGLKATLKSLNFLKSCDLTTLQALTLYLLALQGSHDPHYTWVFGGMCTRIAQRLGLHRDGERLGFSPFETEMRRRLWWLVFILDSHCAVVSGLSPSAPPRGADCKKPRNLSDADIQVDAIEFFQERLGPRGMVACLLSYKMGEYLAYAAGLNATVHHIEAKRIGSVPPDPIHVAKMEKIASSVRNDLADIITKYSDPSNGRLHVLATQIQKSITTRMERLFQPPQSKTENGSTITEQDHLFELTILNLQDSVYRYKILQPTGFVWFLKTHFQFDIFRFLMGQLCQRNSGHLVEHAWEIVGELYQFHSEFLDLSRKPFYELATLVLNAWRNRSNFLHHIQGNIPETPGYIELLKMGLGSSTISILPIESSISGLSLDKLRKC